MGKYQRFLLYCSRFMEKALRFPSEGLFLLVGNDASANQSAAKSCFCQLKFGAGCVLTAEDLLCLLVGGFHTGGVDLISPFKGGGYQSDLAVHNAEHSANAGGIAFLAVSQQKSAASTLNEVTLNSALRQSSCLWSCFAPRSFSMTALATHGTRGDSIISFSPRT